MEAKVGNGEEPAGTGGQVHHGDGNQDGQVSTMEWIVSELLTNPVNLVLLSAIVFMLYKTYRACRSGSGESSDQKAPPPLPPMKKQDFTPRQLKEYDGTGPEGRVLMALLGKVYDVTKGKHFYGPGGPYADFAGKDASRGLATFSIKSASEEYDDLSDLRPSELEQAREWELQFSEKYPCVGKLLKPGEQPTTYSDDEDDDEEAIAEEERKLRTTASLEQLKKTS